VPTASGNEFSEGTIELNSLLPESLPSGAGTMDSPYP
jgi:hypothetical protein